MRNVLAILLGMLLAASPGLAGNVEALSIATIQLPPFGFVTNGIETGLSYEIGNAIALEAGYVPDNSLVPFARALEGVTEGTVDMVIMFPNPTLTENAINIGLVLPVENVVMGRADTRLRSFADLRGKMVALVRGARYDDRISTRNGVTVYPVDNYAQCLELLVSKRVDCVVGPKMGLLYSARRQGIPLHALGKPMLLSVGQGSVFLSADSATAERRERIAEAIRTLMLRGVIQQIRGKY